MARRGLATILVTLFVFASLLARSPQTQAEWEKTNRLPDIVKALDAHPGSVVADVGAGQGDFTLPIARVVLPNGRVIGEDISEREIQRMRERAVAAQLTNLEPVVGTVDDPKLPADTFDAVLVHNAYHEFVQHEKMLARILAALKPGGRLVLIEPFHQSSVGLSRDEQTAKHNLAADLGEQELRAAGFTIAERDNDFVKFTSVAGGFWMIVARKPTTSGIGQSTSSTAHLTLLTVRSGNVLAGVR